MHSRGAAVILIIAILTTGLICQSPFIQANPRLASRLSNRAADDPASVSANTLVPNELGQIMILEYHLIGYPEAQWRRTPDHFRDDLQILYQNGYYPVPLEDLVHRRLKVPAGKTPFVLTFDDSSEGQLRFLKQGGQWTVDPLCAVGIMEQFKKEHPDFPLTATFFVLPAIKPGLRLFGQEEYIGAKLNYLVQHGYEIGNHSYWHQNLGKTDDEGVQKQLALAVKTIQSYLPGYAIRSLALPLGVHPKNRALETDGEYQGTRYHHDSVLLVGSGSIPSPYSTAFNPQRLERIQAGDTPWGPGAYVKLYQKDPSLRYISDGNSALITIPKDKQGKLNPDFGSKWKLRILETSVPVKP
jgi:hypothetical protein